MTDQTLPPPPPIDLGNQLLAQTPTALATRPFPDPTKPGQQLLAVTIRTPSATLTVFLTRDEALSYARAIRTSAQAMSGLILPTNGAAAGPGLSIGDLS